MNTSEYFFDLPEELIAKYPPPERGDSRLMLLECKTGKRRHHTVSDLPAILAGPEFCSPSSLPPLLVFNNSRVRKARLTATPLQQGMIVAKGGDAEFLLLCRIDSHSWQCLVNRSKRRKPGCRFCFEGGIEGEIIEAPQATESSGTFRSPSEPFRYVRFSSPIDDDWLDVHGHVPLPPYIKRNDESSDSDRYQTVYADKAAGTGLGPGASVAAPTAGLHFTKKILDALDQAGVERVFVTLHVGLGTFLPVRTEHIEDHVMHEEYYSISEEAARRINAAKAAGRKIIAVGTTAMRTLESACKETETAEGGKKMFVKAGEGNTRIFIYPGFRFNVVNALFTNFHTPESTLLMLVAAFAAAAGACSGQQLILDSYTEAIERRYRFFSYGDAMLMY